MTAPINGPAPLADMRDVKALREVVDREARIAQLREENAALFRAEVRSFIARAENEARESSRDRATMLVHLRRLVEVPGAERETLAPTAWLDRAGAWMAARPTNRALLYGIAFAALAVSVSGCLAHPLAHALLTGRPL
jgi:hypothetical protein